MTDNLIKVEKNDARKKFVDVKGVEPISNIQVIRDYSDSDVSSVSDVSEEPKKKTKKVLRRKTDTQKYQQYEEQPYSMNDYAFLSNPKKMSRQQQQQFEQETESEYSTESEMEAAPSEVSEDVEQKEKQNYEERQKLKQDLLIKIQALEKKGFEFSKKFNMTSSYEEMEFEYLKVKKFIESQAAIKFSRRCLMACVTGIEFLNKRFDPFHIKLDGWSENVMENVDDYDNIFERLYEKYSRKAEVAPEIELLLTLGGSAFMFHLTNSLLKAPSMGSINTVAQNNPNFMAGMMGALSQSMKEASKPPVFKQNGTPSSFPAPIDTREIRKEMKGPSIDPSLFANTPLASNYPKASQPVSQDLKKMYEESQFDDDNYSIASSDSSLSSVSVGSNVKSIKTKGKKGKKNSGIELNIA